MITSFGGIFRRERTAFPQLVISMMLNMILLEEYFGVKEQLSLHWAFFCL